MPHPIDKSKLPRHVAIIMDGNGRWAQERGLSRLQGHQHGADSVERITETAREIGIQYLTLYAFSKENWKRPDAEVQSLMKLLMEFLYSKKQKMLSNGIRLAAIGHLESLHSDVRALLQKTIAETATGDKMTLTLCLSYGARDEILRAVLKCHADLQTGKISAQNFEENDFAKYLDTQDLPDPDLVIRTSGEKRVSNFLLWQSAYAEYVFSDKNWPDFSNEDFSDCIAEYQKRERRFGLTSEQI